MRTLTPHFLNQPRFPDWQDRAHKAREKLLREVAAGGEPVKCFQDGIWQEFKKDS